MPPSRQSHECAFAAKRVGLRCVRSHFSPSYPLTDPNPWVCAGGWGSVAQKPQPRSLTVNHRVMSHNDFLSIAAHIRGNKKCSRNIGRSQRGRRCCCQPPLVARVLPDLVWTSRGLARPSRRPQKTYLITMTSHKGFPSPRMCSEQRFQGHGGVRYDFFQLFLDGTVSFCNMLFAAVQWGCWDFLVFLSSRRSERFNGI